MAPCTCVRTNQHLSFLLFYSLEMSLIKSEPEEENEFKFDNDLYQKPSQNFDQSLQTELTIKQEPGSGYVNSTFHEVTLL